MDVPWELLAALVILCILSLALGQYGNSNIEGFATAAETAAVKAISDDVVARSSELDDLLVLAYPTKKPKATLATVLAGVPASQQYIVNLAPLTCTSACYIGKNLEDAGVFFRHALDLGVRSFIFPLSTYIDDNKVKPLWAPSGSPLLVYRDLTGRITSRNSVGLKDAMLSLNMSLSQITEPIFIKLEAVPGFVPDPSKEEAKYVDFMTAIADSLSPIESRLLTQLGSYGSAQSGLRETEILLQTPLSALSGKILVSTDFDVGKYAKVAYKGKAPRLLNYVNFIVKVATTQGSAVTYKKMALADSSGSKFSPDEARTALIEASTATPPNADLIASGLAVGIQIIPLPLFEKSSDAAALAGWIQPWKGGGWYLKPEDTRYTKPAPVVPATPSQKMNARVTPTAQPGQVVISK